MDTELSIAAEDFRLDSVGRPRIFGLFTLADITWSVDLDTLVDTDVDTLVGFRNLLRTAVKRKEAVRKIYHTTTILGTTITIITVISHHGRPIRDPS